MLLERTRFDLEKAKAKRIWENERRRQAGQRLKPDVNEQLSFAIYFAKHMGAQLVTALEPYFPGVRSGEVPSLAVRGPKRLDLSYSTPEAGLGLACSFKSVHFGEGRQGDAKFTHNLKRNDEELRVEATSHHLRQPYAVLAAVVFLPFESCEDDETSSFASWVEYLWALKGRINAEDAPDRFELVFIGLYDRAGNAFGFYEVGGEVGCPRSGRPKSLLSQDDFVRRLKVTYDRRNGKDFYFEGEDPNS